jgi:hypothetical protein
MLKEAVVAYFKLQSFRFPGRPDENGKNNLWISGLVPIFGLETSRVIRKVLCNYATTYILPLSAESFRRMVTVQVKLKTSPWHQIEVSD